MLYRYLKIEYLEKYWAKEFDAFANELMHSKNRDDKSLYRKMVNFEGFPTQNSGGGRKSVDL